MKYWLITAPKTVELKQINDALTPPGFAKIKMTRAGLSISDINIYRGLAQSVTFPIVPGRQGVGIVSEIGENSSGIAKGQRVVIESHIACGNCISCKNGNSADCTDIKVMGIDTDGLIRDFAIVPIDNVYQLPAHVKDDEAQFVEHIAMAIRTFNELGVRKGEHIAIIGASIIGILLAQVALYYQAIPILIDANQYRLDSAASYDIYYSVNTSTTDAYQKIMQITGGRGCECVAYMASSNDKMQRSFDYACPSGRVAVVGWEYICSELQTDVNPVLSKQLRVIGVNNSYKQIPTAINMLANKAVDVHSLITSEIEFADVPKTLDQMAAAPYQYNKVLIKI